MKYKFRITPWLYVVIAALYVVAGVCLVWNVIRLVGFIKDPDIVTVYSYISVALCIIIPILFAVFVTAMLVSSYYKIENGELVVRYGIVKDKYPLKEMDNVVRDVGKKQLLVVFKDESGLRIVIDEKYFNDFTAELLKAEPSISYGEYAENTKKDDEEK